MGVQKALDALSEEVQHETVMILQVQEQPEQCGKVSFGPESKMKATVLPAEKEVQLWYSVLPTIIR
jgi:hypothetical protein